MTLNAAFAAEIERLVRGVDVFSAATDEDIRAIVRLGIRRAVEDGGSYFLQEEPAEYLYILLSGRIKLCQVSVNGEQVNLRTVMPGQLFGAIGAVQADAPYPACAEALEDSTALAIPSRAFHDLLEERPYLAFGMMKLMSGYIQEMQERYREVVTEKVEQRIARVLLRLASQAGRGEEAGVLIELPFSRQDLAEMAGTTLYTVSRVLSGWEKRGLIAARRELIILSNPHAVVCIAEGLETPSPKPMTGAP
jgi:CRP-like cAMP-binding protein